MTDFKTPTIDADTLTSYFDTLSNWGRWGEDDRIGTLNLITDEKRRQAGELIRSGAAVSLSRDIDPEHADPLHTGIAVAQRFMQIGEVSRFVGKHGSRFDSVTEYVGIAAHGSNTHLDGLAHYSWDGRMYNGIVVDDEVNSIDGSKQLSVRDASHGIVSRGVLLDIPALYDQPWLEPGHPITIDELEEAERRQGSIVEAGDVLLVHTGHVARTLELGVEMAGPLPKQPGLHASTLPWIHDRDIAALGSDAIQDVQPSGFSELSYLRPIHTVSLVAMGMWLIDNVELRELVATCRAQNRFEFFFAMLPWRMVGVTSSATNPIAIF